MVYWWLSQRTPHGPSSWSWLCLEPDSELVYVEIYSYEVTICAYIYHLKRTTCVRLLRVFTVFWYDKFLTEGFCDCYHPYFQSSGTLLAQKSVFLFFDNVCFRCIEFRKVCFVHACPSFAIMVVWYDYAFKSDMVDSLTAL